MADRELIQWRESFMANIVSSAYIEAMFDHVPDIVFCIKDRGGRYVLMSKACVERCGLNNKQDAIGKTAFALFPAPMAERYARQDELLFKNGKPIVDSLDLTVYRDHSTGWCLSMKQPLYDKSGAIIGLACLSKDLVEPSRALDRQRFFRRGGHDARAICGKSARRGSGAARKIIGAAIRAPHEKNLPIIRRAISDEGPRRCRRTFAATHQQVDFGCRPASGILRSEPFVTPVSPCHRHDARAISPDHSRVALIPVVKSIRANSVSKLGRRAQISDEPAREFVREFLVGQRLHDMP